MFRVKIMSENQSLIARPRHFNAFQRVVSLECPSFVWLDNPLYSVAQAFHESAEWAKHELYRFSFLRKAMASFNTQAVHLLTFAKEY